MSDRIRALSKASRAVERMLVAVACCKGNSVTLRVLDARGGELGEAELERDIAHRALDLARCRVAIELAKAGG